MARDSQRSPRSVAKPRRDEVNALGFQVDLVCLWSLGWGVVACRWVLVDVAGW